MSSPQDATIEPDAPLAGDESRLLMLGAELAGKGHIEPLALAALLQAFEGRVAPDAPRDPAPEDAPAADLAPAQVGARAMLAIPRNAEGPLFRERWEAVAFSLAMALADRGVFTWAEWAHAFGGEILRARRDGETGLDGAYYRLWAAALEAMVADKNLA